MITTTVSHDRPPYQRRPLPVVALAALLLGFAAATAPAGAAPRADPWPLWEAHDPESRETVDHAVWDDFLARRVQGGKDGINRIDYRRVSERDRRTIETYVERLAAVPVARLNRDEQFAFWINLYNALTVREVLRHYPVASIRDISSGFFTPGPWRKELVSVAGQALTLDDIEHRILRPIWRDPRIHYVVNCAALGCPNLQREALRADNLEAVLERAAREFVNHPRAVRLAGERLVVSSLYDWYASDFGANDAQIIAHLRRYADAPLAAALAGVADIDDDHYDWALNDVHPHSRLGKRSGS